MIRAAFIAILAALTVTFCQDASASTLNWNRPNSDRYTGTIEAALKRYESKTPGDGLIPADDLFFIKLAVKQKRGWTDVVVIRRDEIDGRENYLPQIQHMHSGAGKVHAEVDRSGWAPDHIERGLVYCAAGPLCVLVPSVCGNVSIVTRIPQASRIIERAPIESGPVPVQLIAVQIPAIEQSPTEQSPLEAQIGQGLRIPEAKAATFGALPQQDEPVSFASGSGPMVLAAMPPLIQSGGGSIVVLQVPPVPPVPEPQTWALMLAGLAFIASIVRRRFQPKERP